MNITWILIGLIAVGTIIVFRPVVIAVEYYFSKSIWPLFAVDGILLIGCSMFVDNVFIGSALAIVGMCFLYGIYELFRQEKRVKDGWYPANPARLLSRKRKAEIKEEKEQEKLREEMEAESLNRTIAAYTASRKRVS